MGHSQLSDISIGVTVAVADSVSFYYRVSSESGYDKFFFLVDGEEMFDASGDLDWERAAFPLAVGSHTLTFRYSKDYSVNSLSDCAWIDNIILPHQSHPATFVHIDTCAVIDSSQWTVVSQSSNGTVAIVDYSAHPSYYLSDDEVVACDSYLWQGREYTETTLVGDSLQTVYGCDSIIGFTITINRSSIGDTAYVNTQANSYEWNGTVYENTGIYQQHLTNSVGCDSVVTLVLTLGNNAITHPASHSVIIYPNPTTDIITIEGFPEGGTVEFFDLTGRLILSTALPASQACGRSGANCQLSIVDLPAGTYLLRLTMSGGTITQRIVKQ